MRAVVDTNILVRALLKPAGSVGPVLTRLRDGDYTLVYSAALLEELVDVLVRPRLRQKYGLQDADVETVLRLILLRGEAVTPVRRIVACRDARDDKVLEAAVAGEVEVIVSGDEDLLVLSPFEGIPIVEPAAFLGMLEPSSRERLPGKVGR